MKLFHVVYSDVSSDVKLSKWECWRGSLTTREFLFNHPRAEETGVSVWSWLGSVDGNETIVSVVALLTSFEHLSIAGFGNRSIKVIQPKQCSGWKWCRIDDDQHILYSDKMSYFHILYTYTTDITSENEKKILSTQGRVNTIDGT